MYIIDTHALLWYLRNSLELSECAFNIINSESTIYVSVASLWEIAIKNSIGKLKLEQSITQIENLCIEKDITILPIKSKHLDLLKNLEKKHNDPFDRLIICQAKSENLCIITRDTIIPLYDIETIW